MDLKNAMDLPQVTVEEIIALSEINTRYNIGKVEMMYHDGTVGSPEGTELTVYKDNVMYFAFKMIGTGDIYLYDRTNTLIDELTNWNTRVSDWNTDGIGNFNAGNTQRDTNIMILKDVFFSCLVSVPDYFMGLRITMKTP
jgi:hypothetical protein